MSARSLVETAVPLGQGCYYMATGLWSVVHRPSFEAVTGPKTDYWLVVTVGLLAFTIGLTLVVAARGKEPTRERVLAVMSAVAFLTVDVVFVAAGVIPPVYLLDAAAEIVLLALWGWLLLSPRQA